MNITNWLNLEENYFDCNLSLTSDREKKISITSVFQKYIELEENTLEPTSELKFLLATASITNAYNKAFNKLYFIQKIFIKLFYPSNLFNLYDQLITKLASEYLRRYDKGSLIDLINKKKYLNTILNNRPYCGDLSICDNDSFEDRESKIVMNKVAKNAAAIFSFLEKAIEIKISTILKQKNVQGIIHQFRNKAGGIIYVIGTLGSLNKQYIDNIPTICEKFKQSHKVFVETMPSFLSYDCLDNGFISMAKEKNIDIIPFESISDQIKLVVSQIVTQLRHLPPSKPPEDDLITRKELTALRIENWQQGSWDQNNYLKTIPNVCIDLLFKNREKNWLKNTNLIEHVSNSKRPVSIVVGTSHVEFFLNLFKELEFNRINNRPLNNLDF